MRSFILVLTSAISLAAFAQPNIEVKAGHLGKFTPGPKVLEALKKFNPEFKVYDLKDFTADAEGLYTTPAQPDNVSASCDQRIPPPVKALPMAVVGDFNGDGVNDAIVLGADKKNQITVGVLSGEKFFRTFVVEKGPLPKGPTALALTLVESKAHAKKIDFYEKCLPPTVKRFTNDAILIGDMMSDNQRLYFYNGAVFVKFKP